MGAPRRLDGAFARMPLCHRLADDRSAGGAGLVAAVSRSPAVQELRRRVEAGRVLSCHSISPPAHSFLTALLRALFPDRPILVVVPDLKTQESVHQDLETWLSTMPQTAAIHTPVSLGSSPQPNSSPARPVNELHFHPAWEVLPHDGRLPHADIIKDRIATLLALASDDRTDGDQNPAAPSIVVTSAIALMQRTFSPSELRRRTRRLQRGERHDPLDLVEWLEEQGYEPEAQATHPGEMSLRGGILDIFPLSESWPVRLEFFGDELESLRRFDPLTQVSNQEIEAVVVPPAGELGLLKQGLGKTGDKQPEPSSTPTPSAPEPATLLDHLSDSTLVVMCEPEALATHTATYLEHIPAGDPLFVDWETLQHQINTRRLTRIELDERPMSSMDPPGFRFQNLDGFRSFGTRSPDLHVVEAQRREFFAQLHRWARQGCQIHVFCNNEGERERFLEIQQEHGFGTTRTDSAPVPRGTEPTGDHDGRPAGWVARLGTLARGFLCEELRLVVVTDAEIFGRYRVQRPRRLKSFQATATRSALDIDFANLEEGDFVVHLQHGIGRYLGLKRLPPGSGRAPSLPDDTVPDDGPECLVIEYAPTGESPSPPKLHVPVSEAHLVSKYVGAGKAHPPLNTLGGTRWARTKEQAGKAVRDLAADLLALQAARESLPGHAFGEDVPWQREFESAFLYEETPDQMRAILDTKHDMEVARPMDRLICGDVGFGKTEVAIRAAFKAVMGGRQVALLVPTTVLAQQHFNTFAERMADYPVRVELLSRFRSRRETQQVIRELASGAVDIIVGTHRLLQSDISFKNLGLVVIDEEQRFGVLQKEKFKLLRQLVDVLTLSATPIPRTLYLALTGARDMSTIATPPQDRLPVETLVVQYDERTIRDAIQRELDRGGQVFFLHNRVTTIETVAQKLRALVPRARIVVGHGQMESDQLEEVMTRFVNGEADVLLSTTIIESGLDIPNANTIIIDRADRFGLSDLYQLRGRVGRYKHQAYAYLLLPRHATLLSDVRKRISAIRQHSTLGSGFKIAMRDLEIRGAGNLLGSEQSGHITAVGFDLYCQLLKQSVSSLKGEPVKPRVDVSIHLDFLAGGEGSGSTARTAPHLPPNYVPDPRQRIELYRKLAQLTESGGIATIRAELRDRFGQLPAPVELLLQLAELRILAGDRQITSIESVEDKIMLTRNGDFITAAGKFPRLTKKEAKARLKEIRQLLLAL